jgi:multidrug transporter EmrE-like cation transporter
LKTCVVFFGGYLFFKQEIDYKNLGGITLTLIGVLVNK